MESSPQENTVREGRSRSAVSHECDGELPGFGSVEAANDTHMLQLARTIEQEIIPRLMLAHRASADTEIRSVGGSQTITTDEVAQFAKLVVSHEEDSALASIETWRARGISIESIYLDLLAPTARHLGELWNEDLCNFTDVTVGLGRLQRVLRELSPALGRNVEHPTMGRRILLMPGPGEQHTFGLVMVGEFFRRAGWDVTGGAWAVAADAPAMVAAEWFDVIGFSIGAEIHLQSLADTIVAVRHATCNHDIAVLVGGPMLSQRPDILNRVGADGMTIDAVDAPALAERMVAEIAGQRTARA